jgi:hypothetical protein
LAIYALPLPAACRNRRTQQAREASAITLKFKPLRKT